MNNKLGVESTLIKVLGLSMVSISLIMVIAAVILASLNDYSSGPLDYLIPVFSAGLLGGLIIFHRPANLTGWFISAFAFFLSFSEFSRQYAIFGVLTQPEALPFARAMVVNAYWGWFPGLICMLVLIPLHFPSGRLLSPRWRLVSWLAVLTGTALTFLAITIPGDGETPGIPNPLGNEAVGAALSKYPFMMVIYILMASLVLFSISSLVIRYHRATRTERKQIKWFAFAIILFAIISMLNIGFNLDFPYFGTLLWQSVWVFLGISIFWYRLFDIDLIIRRTLVYSLLTGMLSGVYFGGVALLQGILTAGDRSQTGGQSAVSGLTSSTTPSAVVIVLTTLIIAALFNPLRRRLQETIDRRFYRQKYDAEKALAEFASAARSETDLKQLSKHLTGTVQETLQPELVGLWLKPSASQRSPQPAQDRK